MSSRVTLRHQVIKATFVALSLVLTMMFVSTAHAADEYDYVPGEILVCPMPGHAGTLADSLVQLNRTVMQASTYSDLVAVDVPLGLEREWIALFESMPHVAYAERNGIGQGGLVPNDTHFDEQWHHRNTGQTGGTSGADIDSVAAWDITTGSADVVVAVLDTGIDSDNPDFVGRIDPDGMDFVNGDDDAEADHPHGTWVSGCVAANANNSFGTTGMDWNCRILPVKVLNQFNAGTVQDLVEGLNYCATQADVTIINLSLINYPGSQSLIDAITNCRNAGKIIIACAGNSGPGTANSSWPGASPDTITIGATDHNDDLAGFSSTGSSVDFVAPGENVRATAHDTNANTFSIVSGCSFATPISAGIASLLVARADDLGVQLTHDDIFDLFLAGAEDQVGPPSLDTAGYDINFGFGRLNAHGSLEAVALLADCDQNGTLDTVDIATSPERDLDNNGVLDECEPRPNDTCASAPLILAGETPFTTNGALEDGPTEVCGMFTTDIWYRFVVSEADLVTVSVCDAPYDVEMALYTFTCPNTPGTAIACSQNDCGSGARISTMLEPGLYRVRVSGALGATGVATLSLAIGPVEITCPWDCAPDNGDGTFGNGLVNIDDLFATINAFGVSDGPCDSSPDNGDGTFGNGLVNIDDLFGVINTFGDCPE